MIDLIALADLFGRKITTLAVEMGYTRQSLYNAVREKRVNRIRMIAALKHLQLLNDEMYEKDMAAAAARYKARKEGVIELSEEFGIDQIARI